MFSFMLTPVEIDALILSVKVACWSVAFSLPVGITVGWVLSRTFFIGKGIVEGVVHLPLVLPPVVIGYLLLVSFGKNGVIGKYMYDVFGVSIAFTWKGAVLASAIMAFPLLVRAIKQSFDAADRAIEQAARTLGAGPVRVFFTITLPLATPGILTGMLLAFARSLGEFGATITFVSNIQGQTQTLPLALYNMTQVPNGEVAAMRLCILSLIIAFAALFCANRLELFFTRKLQG